MDIACVEDTVGKSAGAVAPGAQRHLPSEPASVEELIGR
jgi:hypothetical protein